MRWLRRGLAVLGLIAVVMVVALGAVVVVDGWLSPGAAAVANAHLEADGRSVLAYVAEPEGPGPHPAIILIHEWWGLNAEMARKADALAAEGYIVLAVDTYQGASTRQIPRAIYLVTRRERAQVNADLDTAYQVLAQAGDVDMSRVAVMGFCYGGGRALAYSLHNPTLAATVVFYGDLVTDPARLRALSGPVLGIFGGADRQIPVSEVDAFGAALTAAKIPHEITIYPGQPHAFANGEAIAQPGPAREAWQQTLDFLARTLR